MRELLFLQIFDVITTMLNLYLGGAEFNPMAAIFVSKHGFIGLLIWKVAFAFIAGYFVPKMKNGPLILGGVNLFFSLVVLNNMIVLVRLISQL